jgi:hypothetical protein
MRIHKRIVTVVLVLLSVAAVAVAPALAQSATTPISNGSRLLSAAAQPDVYWTEERMNNARPLGVPAVAASPAQGGPLVSGPPSGVPVVANSGGPGDAPEEVVGTAAARLLQGVDPLSGAFPFSYTRYRLFPDALSTYKDFPYRLTGKLFFTIPGSGDFVCSASSVNSTNKSVVWTAGHCVYSPGIGYHMNFAFAPARRLGSNPYGLWTAKAVDGAWTLSGWAQFGLFNYDHGALVMNTKAGAKIGNKIGFLGFAANVSRLQHWHLHGYPQGARNLAQTPPGAQFDGYHHEICAAAWATDDQPGDVSDPPTVGVGCDQTGGTSGGPWVIDFSGVTGATNILNGNNSYRYLSPNPPENLKLFSPYFSDGAINLRNAAQAVPVP